MIIEELPSDSRPASSRNLRRGSKGAPANSLKHIRPNFDLPPHKHQTGSLRQAQSRGVAVPGSQHAGPAAVPTRKILICKNKILSGFSHGERPLPLSSSWFRKETADHRRTSIPETGGELPKPVIAETEITSDDESCSDGSDVGELLEIVSIDPNCPKHGKYRKAFLHDNQQRGASVSKSPSTVDANGLDRSGVKKYSTNQGVRWRHNDQLSGAAITETVISKKVERHVHAPVEKLESKLEGRSTTMQALNLTESEMSGSRTLVWKATENHNVQERETPLNEQLELKKAEKQNPPGGKVPVEDTVVVRKGERKDSPHSERPTTRTVTLKQGEVKERRQAGEWMLDTAIEEAINKRPQLNEGSRVRVLVEAFESIMCLSDSGEKLKKGEKLVVKPLSQLQAHTEVG